MTLHHKYRRDHRDIQARMLGEKDHSFFKRMNLLTLLLALLILLGLFLTLYFSPLSLEFMEFMN